VCIVGLGDPDLGTCQECNGQLIEIDHYGKDQKTGWFRREDDLCRKIT